MTQDDVEEIHACLSSKWRDPALAETRTEAQYLLSLIRQQEWPTDAFLTLGHGKSGAVIGVALDRWTAATFRKGISHLNRVLAFGCDCLGHSLTARLVWNRWERNFRLEWSNYRGGDRPVPSRRASGFAGRIPVLSKVAAEGGHGDQVTSEGQEGNHTSAILPITAYSDVLYELNEVLVEFAVVRQIYLLTFRKEMRNVSSSPITRALFHFLPNVFPHDPARSFRHYRENPIDWSDIRAEAWDKDGPLDLELVNDHGSRKDFLVYFRQGHVERPVVPGESREFWYRYQVSMKNWGSYIDRPIGFPTRLCRVILRTPGKGKLLVGGFELSPLRERRSFDQRIRQRRAKGRTDFIWESSRLTLGNTYQITWAGPGISASGVTRAVTTDQLLVQQT